MNQPSPYQPPQSPYPSYGGLPHPADIPPGSVKVFGVLHIVFAIFGVLSAIWAVLQTLLFQTFFMRWIDPAQREMQQMIHDRTAWLTWITSPLTLAVGVIMLMAGIKLVKLRADGLKWSNRYAWTSIVMKVIMLVLTATVTVPAIMAGMREMIGHQPRMGGAESVVLYGVVGGAIIGVVVTFVYPVLTLIVLNRQPVKEWFARRQTAPGVA